MSPGSHGTASGYPSCATRPGSSEPRLTWPRRPRRGLRPPHSAARRDLRATGALIDEGRRGGRPASNTTTIRQMSAAAAGAGGRASVDRRMCGLRLPHSPYRGRPNGLNPLKGGSLANRGEDLVREAPVLAEELGTLPLQPLDVRQVLVEAACPFVELARLQHLVVV